MFLEIEEIKQLFDDWESRLNNEQKTHMHFYSFRNFLFHFDKLSSNGKENVLRLFNKYILVVENAGFYFDKLESYEIAKQYLDGIAPYYKNLNFKLNFKLRFVFYWGLLIDFLLFVAHVLPEFYGFPIPILTLIMLSYHLYLFFFKKRRKLIYGIFY